MNNTKWILFLFLLVPIIFSLISTIHLISFVNIGNPYTLSVIFSITVELGALVTFIAVSPNILKKLNKTLIFYMFIVLFSLQAIGNMYSVYDYTLQKLSTNPNWLNTFNKMTLNFFDNDMLILIVSILLGLFVPIFSLILLKSALDYVNEKNEEFIEVDNESDNKTPIKHNDSEINMKLTKMSNNKKKININK